MLRPISIRCKRWPTIAGARWSEFEGNRHSDLNRTKVIGVLSIQSYTPRAYAQADLNTLQTLADHCGGALERIRAEQALRESEQRFRDLFEGSPDAVFVEDLTGTVLDINPAACRLHGATRKDLLGKNVVDLVPPERREEAARDFQALVQGQLQQIEGTSCMQDGWPGERKGAE